MTPWHHVLLIGIDAYDGDASLDGCVNDIDRMQRLLIDRVGIDPARITRLASPAEGTAHETDVAEELPTLARIRDALDRLASDAVAPGDRVLIYFAGHGSHVVLKGEHGHRFSREALLPKDMVRLARRQFLFDWELNAAIARIAQRTPRVTVVLDACASAGATRDVSDAEPLRDRYWPTPDVYELRPEDHWVDRVDGKQRGLIASLGIVGACQLIAACRDDERARERSPAGAAPHGLFSRALLEALESLPAAQLQELRWGRIWRAVERNVRTANPRQNPYISGGFGRRVFGFGVDEDGDPGYAITRRDGEFLLDVGELQGVAPGAEIAVYGEQPTVFPALGSTEDLAARCGVLRVTQADATSCQAVAVTPFPLPPAPRGRLVKAGPAGRLRVLLVPYDADLAANLGGSDLLEVVERSAGDPRDVVELAQRSDGVWEVTDDIHGAGRSAGEPELVSIPPDRLYLARALLEHYHGYSAPIRLARACRDLPNQLMITLLDGNGRSVSPDQAHDPDLPLVEGGLRAYYETSVDDRLCIAVHNASSVALWVTLIDCATSGRVQILGEQMIPAYTRRAFWANDVLGSPFIASLPRDRQVGIDRLVAIGTTDRSRSLRHLQRAMAFEEVLQPRRAVREANELRSLAPDAQWTAAMATMRITRQARSQAELSLELRGTPGEFASSMVLPDGRRITAYHRLALVRDTLESVTAWASRGNEWLKRDGAFGPDDLAHTAGAQLFRAVFDGEIGAAYDTHIRRANDVRIRLQLEDPELAALPWEFLYDDRRGRFVALSAGSAVVHALGNGGSAWLPYPLLRSPIRVLSLKLSATDRPPSAEPSRLSSLFRVSADSDRAPLAVVHAPAVSSLQELAQAIQHTSVDILHLDGVGGADTEISTLMLERARLEQLAIALPDLLDRANPRPRIVMLSASDSDGLAWTLAQRAALEAVIGIRGNVSDRAAAMFFDRFYAALLSGATVIRSVTEARLALYTALPGQREWGLFRLYHRAGDLAIEPARATARPPAATDRIGDPRSAELAMLRRNREEIERRLRDATGRSKALLDKQRAEIEARIAELEGRPAP